MTTKTLTALNPITTMIQRGLIAFSPDAATPPAPPAGDSAPTPVPSVADAGKAFLASLTEEQKKAPVQLPPEKPDGIDDAVDDEHEADGVATPPKVDDVKKPDAAKPADAAAAAAPEELVIARDDGATWNETAKRWQNAAGAFVDGDAPTADELSALETAKTEAKTAADAAANAGAKKKVVLAGLSEKGEQDIELELDDETAAERIRRLQNDGMRRKAFQEAKGQLDNERAELTAVSQAIEADPVSFIVGQMTPERQLDVARALLAEHFDKLIPDIQSYDDTTNGARLRADARLALRDRVDESRSTITETQQRQRHAVACLNAAHALVPDNADTAVVNDFMRDVELDLVQAARSGKPVTPETVPQLIERRMKLYGFGAAPSSAAAPAAPAPPAPAGAAPAKPADTARPIGDRASAIAARVVTKEEARNAQSRIRKVQITRQNAAAVAPPGAGAAPVQVPVIPATADIKEASKIIRKQGQAGWASAG
jgi:hypothetical protein